MARFYGYGRARQYRTKKGNWVTIRRKSDKAFHTTSTTKSIKNMDGGKWRGMLIKKRIYWRK